MIQVFPDAAERHLLVVTDAPEAWATVGPQLQARGWVVSWAVSAKHALVRLETGQAPWRVVLCDLKNDDENLEAVELLVSRARGLTLMLACDESGISLAVRALRAGVAEVLERPFELESMLAALTTVETSPVVADAQRFDSLVGHSAPMRELQRTMERIADREFTVLISGEPGTGKEVVARALHAASRRAGGPFVAVNCAALPESLLESELFGHVANAFTDAGDERLGLLRSASGGTLFLDQIGELPRALQPKLLRVLQERTVRPLGASREEPIDVRVICAATGRLHDAVQAGHFREDLYFRLDVVRLELPALRTRETDVLQLADHFLVEHSRRSRRPARHLSLEVAARFLEYEWPGNVRELFGVLEGVLAMSNAELIEVSELPQAIATATRPLPHISDSSLRPWAEIEKGYILQVMNALKGNKRRAAMMLGLDRTTLYRKLQAWS
ncbi:MAG: sigma 54-interacting transcriptional regulator [Archangium sp.]